MTIHQMRTVSRLGFSKIERSESALQRYQEGAYQFPQLGAKDSFIFAIFLLPNNSCYEAGGHIMVIGSMSVAVIWMFHQPDNSLLQVRSASFAKDILQSLSELEMCVFWRQFLSEVVPVFDDIAPVGAVEILCIPVSKNR